MLSSDHWFPWSPHYSVPSILFAIRHLSILDVCATTQPFYLRAQPPKDLSADHCNPCSARNALCYTSSGSQHASGSEHCVPFLTPKLISCQCLALASCIAGTFRRAPHERRRDHPVQKSSECRYREGIQPYRPNPLLQQRTRRVVKQG